MKKLARNISILLIALLLACCLVVGFAACGDDDGNENNSGGSGSGTVVEPTEGGKTKYTFEAENTNLSDTTYGSRSWTGYSQNIPNPCMTAKEASGGYCVGSMYVSESYIYFEIESDTAATAEFTLCAAMEAFCSNGETTVTLTDSQYRVWYGAEGDILLEYGSITFDFTGVGSGVEDRTAFKEYDLGQIELVAGTNLIFIDVNNTRAPEGGSSKATAPIVDYITLETTASLSWTPIDNLS